MLITPHILLGTALGVAVGNPVAGFALGVASHYILDAVPHTDSGTWHFYEPFASHSLDARDFTMGILDAAAAFFGFLALSSVAPIVASGPIAGAIGGALPDGVMLISLFAPKFNNFPGMKHYNAFVKKFHYTAPPKLWALGIVTQLAVSGVSIWYLLGS